MPSPIRWIWNRLSKRFRRVPGGTVKPPEQVRLRDDFSKAQNLYSARSASRLASGEWTVNRWHMDARIHLKQVYIAQYMAGRGGRDAMTAADWANITKALDKQYTYLDKFAAEIASGKLSDAQIAQRMQLYFESASAMMEQGKASAYGLNLPQYPGDGATACRTNCKCEWDIEEFPERYECTWKLNPAEHCEDCLSNAAKWAPLVIAK